jgi:MFS family permease
MKPLGLANAGDNSPGRAPIPESRLSTSIRALRHRNFRLFFGGQLISLIGTWMQTVAQSWLVYRLTGSSLLLGMVGFSSQIPVFLIAPLGGATADRRSRHSIILTTQTASALLALVLAVLTLTRAIQVWHVLVLAACLGVVNAFDIPARQAFIVEMVGREDLMNAIALNSSMFNSARIVGPSIAGILVAAIGEGWCFFANGVSYVAVIAGLLLMKVPKRQPAAAAGSTLAHILEGFQFVRKNAPVRALLLLLGLASVVGMPYAVLMPVFADRILHGGARGLGILMASTGVGALVGALGLAYRSSGVRGLGKWVALASGGFGTSLILFALSRSFWLSAALLIPVGLSMMVQMASCNTLIQSMVPDRLRGRVMAVYSQMFMGMAPFGALLAGSLAERIGAPLTILSGGLLCVAGSALFAARLSSLRPQARALILAQITPSGVPPDDLPTRPVT